MTHNQFIKLFRDIATNHRDINSFGTGDLWEYMANENNTLDPVTLWVVINNNTITDFVDKPSYSFVVLDYVNKDESNEDEVLSDTNRIAKDIIAILRQPYYEDFFEIDKNFTLEDFTERFDSECSGWKFDITFKQNFTYDACQVNQTGLPIIIGNDTPSYTVTPAFTLTTVGSSGAATYSLNTGILNIPVYTGGGNETLAQILANGNTTNGNSINTNDDDQIQLGDARAVVLYYHAVDQAGEMRHTVTGDEISFKDAGGIELTSATGFKLVNSTANTVPYLDANKRLVSSAVTPTQLGYLDATSSIQTQLAGKLASSSVGYNVQDYGILPTNTAAANNSALNTLLNTTAATGSTIYFPPASYNFSVVTTVSNKYFNFLGHGATINMTANTQFLDMSSTVALTGAGSRWTFKGFIFNGTGSGAAQTALYFSIRSGLFEVSDCLFTNWGNTGLTIGTTNTASTSQAGCLGGIISNCRFYNNGKGVSCIDLGEYIQIVGCQFIANTMGIYLLGGNALVNGNTISYNTTGIEIGTGTNPGKHIISNNHITHNTTSANIHDTLSTQGLYLENNNIIIGTLIVANTYGVTISGGIINADAYTFNTNAGFIIKDVRSANSLANTITLTGNAPTYINCLKLDGSYAYNLDQYGATLEATVSTTNATVTTLHTIAAVSSLTTTVVGYVSARRTGGAAGASGDGALYRVEYVAKNTGSAALIGSVVTVIGESQAGWDVTLTASSGNILIQVTGAASNNITWKWTALKYDII